MRSEKKSFLVLFYSAKPNSAPVRISNFSSFFKKLFFLLFRPLYCTGEKSEVSKRSLFSALLLCKNHFRPFYVFRTFSSFFFQKTIFFLLFRTLYCKGEKHKVRTKIIFSALLLCKTQFRPCYDFKFFKFFSKN